MCNTEAIIRHCLQEGVKMTLVINKIDRLILELRIKPADAFYKIKHTLEEVNTFIRFEFDLLYAAMVLLGFHIPAALTRILLSVSAQRTAMWRLQARTCTGVSLSGRSRRCMRTLMVMSAHQSRNIC